MTPYEFQWRRLHPETAAIDEISGRASDAEQLPIQRGPLYPTVAEQVATTVVDVGRAVYAVAKFYSGAAIIRYIIAGGSAGDRATGHFLGGGNDVPDELADLARVERVSEGAQLLQLLLLFRRKAFQIGKLSRLEDFV